MPVLLRWLWLARVGSAPGAARAAMTLASRQELAQRVSPLHPLGLTAWSAVARAPGQGSGCPAEQLDVGHELQVVLHR